MNHFGELTTLCVVVLNDSLDDAIRRSWRSAELTTHHETQPRVAQRVACVIFDLSRSRYGVVLTLLGRQMC